ncbi:MAG: EAL domain-containing protein [Gammaproteobacteria bacterium]|nr:EAL domain-containing protein [Gammaproteobacteria bacterium]
MRNCRLSSSRAAKESAGRNNYQFYADDIDQASKNQMRLEVELYRALENDELVVYYQPKVDLRSGDILGMEALSRWQHPQMGLVPPNDFIPPPQTARAG